MRIARFLAALVIAGALFAIGGTAGAGLVVLTVEVDPTSGPPGTEVAVTGTCLDGADECNATGTVIEIELVDATAAVIATAFAETENAAGDYETVIVVPGTATADTYTVRAVAVESATDTVVAEAETEFTVPEPASSVPTVDVPPAPELVVPVPAPAPPPAPVPARPRVTG